MRKPVFLIFTNAMILLVIFALLAQSLVIVQRLAVAQNVTGRVEVQRSGRGAFQLLGLQDAIRTGDVVRSGHDGNAEFQWADGTRWKILPNTQIVVKKSTSNLLKRGEQSQLELLSGKVFIRIVKPLAPGSRFEITTANAVAEVRGTIFSVEIQNGRSEVAVFKGRVKVHKIGDDAAAIIEPGQQIVASDAPELQTRPDARAQQAFAAEPTMVKPTLSANVRCLDDGKVLLSGQTEAGDVVTVNNQAIRVLGNGVFRVALPLPANRQFSVVTTDCHNEQTKVIKTLNAAAPVAAP